VGKQECIKEGMEHLPNKEKIDKEWAD